jgi:hypothetical protein
MNLPRVIIIEGIEVYKEKEQQRLNPSNIITTAFVSQG